MEYFDSHVKILDDLVATHWREMVNKQAELDVATLEKFTIEEDYESLVNGYKERIQELEEKLRVAEEGIKERDERLRAISMAAKKTELVPGSSKESSPSS